MEDDVMGTGILNQSATETVSTGGLIFTNNKGQIIFANQGFLDLMHYEHRQPVMGKPLHTILGIEARDTSELLEDARDGKCRSRSLVLNMVDRDGEVRAVQIETLPAYDSSDRFLGINIIVKPVQEEADLETTQVRTDAAAAVAEFERSFPQQPLDERALLRQKGATLRDFFTAQIDTLQIYMARIAGLRVRDALEMILNETSQKHLLPVAMVDGNIYIDPVAEDAAVYRLLLGEIAKYASCIIGWGPIVAEMRGAEAAFGEEVLATATETGLRGVYLSHA
jgi:PAS domain S-box-containing protein